MKQPPIKILDEEIDPERFPVLYKWAQTNPEGLASQLKSISEKNKESVGMSMVNLESDLRTDNS